MKDLLSDKISVIMRVFTFIGILVVSSITATAQIAAGGSDPIAHVREQWVKSFDAKNLNGLIALYADDAALLVPSGERLSGKDKIVTHFRELFSSASALTITLDSVKTDSSGELGYDSGQYEEAITHGGGVAISGNVTISGNASISGGGGRTQKRGTYLVVLKRERGNWLIAQQAITEAPQPSAAK